ncbi:MAG: hypothetical protein AAGN35_07185 [Bacteroidota bacterium]
MKKFITILLGLLLASPALAQTDSAKVKNWRLNSFGFSHSDGNVQFFEGYNHNILYADARFGLPLYPDWSVYSGIVLLPEFYRFGGHVNLVDTARSLKLRITGEYSYRKDSLATTSGFALNDTIFGRNASEAGTFFGVSVAGMKHTRKFLGFLRLYGGAELEFSLSPRSDIFFVEYGYDVGENRIVDLNYFETQGKLRMHLWARALLGVEMVFFDRFGVNAEIKSGLGTQLVLQETSFGMGTNMYYLGVNYYLWDYARPKRIDPAPVAPPATPLPRF